MAASVVSSSIGELSSSAGVDDVVSAGASVAVELSSEPQAASPKDIVSASAASPVLATRVRCGWCSWCAFRLVERCC